MAITNEPELNDHIERSARALTTIAPLLPTLESVQSLIEQSAAAKSRGYFLPNEDEQVRIEFSHYLTMRAALVSVLEDLRPYVLEELKRPTAGRREVFLIAFCAACMLVRTGRFLVDTFRDNRFVVRKLDEAEPRFGIPPRQFTRIYRSLSSPQNVWVFLEAIRYFREHKQEILELESNPILKPVVDLLRGEEPFIESSTMYYTKNRWKYRLHSFMRRHHSGFKKVTFGLFRISGSLIAVMRNQWRRKRVTPVVQRKLARMLKPGDVIITRHDNAASNLFFPGFWPHSALYIGTEAQRREIDASGVTWQREQCPDPNCILEARQDGVLFRPIHETFNVDACVVLRPKLPADQICEAISRAMTHQGKRYDFEFDFRRTDRLVCTELIYRAYHGIGDVEFELTARRGRICFTAEDLLDCAVEGKFFDIICIYGSNGNRFVIEDRAANLDRKLPSWPVACLIGNSLALSRRHDSQITVCRQPSKRNGTTNTSSHFQRSVNQIKLDIKATPLSISLPILSTDNNFIRARGSFAEPIVAFRNFRIGKLLNLFNNTDLVRAQSRPQPKKSFAFLVALLTGLLFSPDTVRSQVVFRQPNVPQKRTLRGQLVGSATRVQEGLKAIRQKSKPSPLIQPPATSRPQSVSLPTTPANSISDFGDDGFLSVELGKGGLNPYSGVQLDQANSPESHESNQGQGYLNSKLTDFRQGTEELPPSLSAQSNFDTDGLEEIRQNFPDGQPRIIRFVAQDEEGNYYNHGPWKVYNQAQPQEIVAAGTYRQGRMHGQWQRRHDAGSGGLFATKPFDLYKGPFLSVANFHDGKLNGIWTIYDSDQRNIFEINYKNGVRNGKATWWHPNRSKMREATFQDGLLHGEILAWDESEKLVRREEFVEGRRIVRNTTFYRPDQKQSEDYFLDSQLIPEGEDNWWDATPTPYLPQGSQVQNGPSMKWYENKQPKQQGQYSDGLQVGQFTWWHANGNKQIEGFYVDGKKNRLWTWWYENGMKQFEGMYQDDEPVGHWRSWHVDGQLRKEENFSLEPPSGSNYGDEPSYAEQLNPKTVIEPPSESLPIPENSKAARTSTPAFDDSRPQNLEGIEPLNDDDSQAPGKGTETEGNPTPNRGSSGGGDQSDGSLPSVLFDRQKSVD